MYVRAGGVPAELRNRHFVAECRRDDACGGAPDGPPGCRRAHARTIMRGMHRALFRRRRVFLRGIALILGVCGLAAGPGAQAPAAQSPVDARSRDALLALDRYLETWNSRIPALWAASLHLSLIHI